MRRFALLAVASLALFAAPLAACAPILSPPNQIVAAKVEYGFEAAYNVAASAYLDALDAGALTADQKAQAKPLLQKCNQARKAAQKAQDLGEADNLAAQTALAVSLANQVLAIIGPPH